MKRRFLYEAKKYNEVREKGMAKLQQKYADDERLRKEREAAAIDKRNNRAKDQAVRHKKFLEQNKENNKR